MTETPSSTTISTKLERIATLARDAPGMAFTTLAHYIDLDWLREAYRRTRKDGATGVDGQTAADYAGNLEANLRSLLDRAKSGRYRAPPVRRVHIPKGEGTTDTRTLGIPTFEDSHDLRVPRHMHLEFLPPYSPELNPVESVWDHLREHYFANRVFASIAGVSARLGTAFRELDATPQLVRSMTLFDWIKAAKLR